MKECRLLPSDGNDGDSFHFLSGGEEYIARLYFVDCAEKDDQVPDRIVQQMAAFGVSEDKVYAYGHEAKKFAERVLARPFTVVTRFQDARGRSKLPRYYSFVFPNGSRQDLGTLLTEAGLARSFGQTALNDLRLDRAHYDRLEEKARRGGLGIFGGRKPSHATELSENIDASSTADAEPVETPEPKEAAAPVVSHDLMIPLIDMLSAQLKASTDALIAAISRESVEVETSRPSGARINLNTATRSELESLPGINAVMADGIIEHRPYSAVADLLRVPMLGGERIKQFTALVEF